MNTNQAPEPDPFGRNTTYCYGPNGISHSYDAVGNRMTISYDVENKVQIMAHSDGTVTTLPCDGPPVRPVKKSKPKNNKVKSPGMSFVTTYVYDNLGYLISPPIVDQSETGS